VVIRPEQAQTSPKSRSLLVPSEPKRNIRDHIGNKNSRDFFKRNVASNVRAVATLPSLGDCAGKGPVPLES
jgi:hypothetical protein